MTLFLTSRGLLFQGSSTKIGDVNNGNFLGILELLRRYDEITRGHLAYVKEYQNEGESMKERTHYLSLILEKNNIAFYSPCSAHSLNLVGVNAVKINSRVKTFFGCVQSLFVSFSSSLAKWNILSEEVGVSLESQSETRWSSRVSAIRPIVKHLPGILKSLNRVLTEINMPDKIYSKIMALKKYFSSFECIAMARFWFKVLSSINERNIIIFSLEVYHWKLKLI